MSDINPNVIRIIKGSTRIQVKIDRYSGFLLLLRDMLKRKLTDYTQDPRSKQWLVSYRYFTYDRLSSTLSLPVNAMDLVTQELDGVGPRTSSRRSLWSRGEPSRRR